MRSNLAYTLALALVLSVGTAVVAVEPVYACHEETGWCCTDREDHDPGPGDFCCWFSNGVWQFCVNPD